MNVTHKYITRLWWFIWGIALILCLIFWLYFAFNKQDLKIINIEFGFYLSVLGLAATSMLKMRCGKSLLYGVILISAFQLYLLPEFQQIEIIETCIEDNDCEMAVRDNLILSKLKMKNNRE